MWGPTRTLTGNVLRGLRPLQLGGVAFFSTLCGVVAVVASNTILRHGPDRFDLAPFHSSASSFPGLLHLLPGRWDALPMASLWIVGLASLMVTISLAVLVWESDTSRPWNRLKAALGLAAGVGGAIGLAWAAAGGLHSFRGAISSWRPPAWLGPGYVERSSGELFELHAYAALLLLIWVTLYVLVTFFRLREFQLLNWTRWSPIKEFFSTQAYLLILLTSVCWLLAGAEFFLGRYRIPVEIGPLVVFVVALSIGKLDNYFEVDPREAIPRATPSEVLYRDSAGKHRAVVLLLQGGGIWASAWAGQVLAGLEEEMLRRDKKAKLDPAADGSMTYRWRRGFRAASSASGGSVGLFHYLSGWPHDNRLQEPDPALQPQTGGGSRPPLEQSEKEEDTSLYLVRRNAGAALLDAVGWGLTGPDLIRKIVPIWLNPLGRRIDRGWALERAIASFGRRRKEDDARSDDGERLSDWAARSIPGSSEYPMPVALINSTHVEGGEPVVFSTSDFRPAIGLDFVSRQVRDQTGKPHTDLRAATAARLSAAFPFVSPKPRPEPELESVPALHLADGGYFDNFGANTLISWLQQGFQARPREADLEVLILQVVAMPEEDPSHAEEEKARRSKRSWPFQLLAPLKTLYNVALGSQAVRSKQLLDLFISKWSDDDPARQACPPNGIRLRSKQIQYRLPLKDSQSPAPEPPLNWRLLEADKQNLGQSWQEQAEGYGDMVQDFLVHGLGPLTRDLDS